MAEPEASCDRAGEVETGREAYALCNGCQGSTSTWPDQHWLKLVAFQVVRAQGRSLAWHARACARTALSGRPRARRQARAQPAARRAQAGGLRRLTLRGHAAGIVKVLLTPGGVDIITVSTDGTARVWDMEIGDCVLLLAGHGGAITDVAASAVRARTAPAGRRPPAVCAPCALKVLCKEGVCRK